ncbi:Bicupin oxalate decarboxylase oxidase [Mycena vulgaris]|nr:Bicupin oxalate decarboxylase oxidase [Mycena vulgaris]
MLQHWDILVATVLSSIHFSAAAPAIVSHSSLDPNYQLWDGNSKITPEPVRGSLGATILGPQNVPVALQNADSLAPPTTDSGQVPNMKWPFSLSHTRLANGGWARQQNVESLPIATGLAGVNMRLEPGAIRELHWHNTAEWAYILKGDVRISTITPDGQVYLGDVVRYLPSLIMPFDPDLSKTQGDIWYFPAGNPHSLQAKKDGAEFLLVNTMFLAQNFGQSLSAFDHIPEKQLYIFPSSPPPEDIETDMVVPNNTPNPYTFALSKVAGTKKPGGTIKVIDSRTFTVAQTISAVEVTVEVGGMRELHWHPTEPEWSYFISGEARVTVFTASSKARTYDFQAGDVGYIPPSFGHHVVNSGNTTLKFLEIFKSNLFQDISLTQWLALTPPELVKAHLGFSDDTIASLSRVKHEVV